MPHAIIILADGFEEIEAVTCIDLLRRAGITVTVLGLDAVDVRGAQNLWVKADMPLAEFRDSFDAVVLPGGMPGTTNLAASEETLNLIRFAYEEEKLCAAICAAPAVLAKAGILSEKKVTCYPGCESYMSGALLFEDAVVTDYNIITSRAVGTAIPFALELIEVLAGQETARKIKAAILY
ncbi:MAG: DJ-1/PfpI family protein [Chitinispirillales bacterium]|jgi:4-methyl-5(b-hydroxyethyl)-thiazole monophosphate biosynthesis|nr:DJ-1/PfpI family protein [Chitinispirillales bacterium]